MRLRRRTAPGTFTTTSTSTCTKRRKVPAKAIGIFGRFGASDGNPNPMHYFYSIGIGGKGIIPGRPLDRFGIGYYYMDVSNPKFTGPVATRDIFEG